jgi:large subunit ribosomal protein L18
MGKHSEGFIKRRRRVRGKISGTKKRPRLSVFKSNKAIYAQIINDEKQETLVSASSLEMKKKKDETKTDLAFRVGEEIAKLSKKKKIKDVVFDRSGYKYHGRVKALADGARKGGLNF